MKRKTKAIYLRNLMKPTVLSNQSNKQETKMWSTENYEKDYYDIFVRMM